MTDDPTPTPASQRPLAGLLIAALVLVGLAGPLLVYLIADPHAKPGKPHNRILNQQTFDLE